MRKVGTKHAACNPVQYLTKFWRDGHLVRPRCSTSRSGRPTWYVSGQGPGQLQLVRYSTSLEYNIIRTPELEFMLVLIKAVTPESHHRGGSRGGGPRGPDPPPFFYNTNGKKIK